MYKIIKHGQIEEFGQIYLSYILETYVYLLNHSVCTLLASAIACSFSAANDRFLC